MTVDLTWAEFKDFLADKPKEFDYLDRDNNYFIYASDGAMQFSCIILKSGDPFNPTADEADFDSNYKTLGNKPLSSYVIQDKVNSYLTYEGLCHNTTIDPSAACWQIKRTIKQGNFTKVEYANGGSFDQIWDDRATLFTGTGFFNQLSCYFDGVNDYIDLGNNYAFETNTAFSISMWIKPQNFAATRYFISKLYNGTGNSGYCLGIDTSGKIITQVRSASSALAASTFNTVLTADTWTHVVWVWTGSGNQQGQQLYINGALDSYTPTSAPLVGSWITVEPLVIGRRIGANYFVGKIDEAAIYDKALNSSEALAIYNSGSPGDLTLLGSSGNLKSWWRLGDSDTFPNVLDQVDSIDGVMTNMLSSNFVGDVP